MNGKFGGGDECIIILIVVIATWEYLSNIQFKHTEFITCQLYFSKAM